jgi:hypothetical protein
MEPFRFHLFVCMQEKPEASALRKSDPLALPRSDPRQEQDWEG